MGHSVKTCALGAAGTRPTQLFSHRGSSGEIFELNETQQILKARNTKTSKLQSTKSAGEGLQNEACRFGLKFPLATSILPPA